MKTWLVLWQREMASFFRTSVAYVVGVFFLAVTGFSFWLQVTRLAQSSTDSSMSSVLFGSTWFWLAMLIVIPLLTMRLFAEEQRVGTLETLLTAPVTESHVVWAKFAGAYATFLVLWIPTLFYGLILGLCGANLPPMDWGPVAAGYLGTALVGAAFLSVGLLCSILTKHQIIAAMGCLAALGILLLGGLLPYMSHTEELRRFSRQISAPMHMIDFAAGVIDTRAVVLYVSATLLLLFVSIRLLEARRLR